MSFCFATGGFCLRLLLIFLALAWFILQQPVVAQVTGDLESQAARGLRLLRTQPYGTADLQVAQFDQLWRYWPEELRREAQKATAVQRRKMSFDRYGFVADPQNPDGPPLGVVDDQQGGWVMNCLSCHQGTVDGNVVWGAGNTHFAFQTLVDDVLLLLKDTGQPGNPILRLLKLGTTNGTTNAQVFSILLSSLRDRDLNPVLLPKLIKYQNHDLDAPPLWNVKYKKNLYIDGYVPKNHRIIMQFTLVPSNDGNEIKLREDGFRDVLAWIESLVAPSFPHSIDQQLAEIGETVFKKACADCHGTYGTDAFYPEVRIPLKEIGTDPVRLIGMPPAHRRFMQESWFGNYGDLNVVEEPDGYVAPPLNGVWASPPYLHNGSVPTLWHLMNPTQRPTVWTRKADSYDWQRVGLDVEQLNGIPQEVQSTAEKRRYFDTSLSGKSAAGHNFPDELSTDEKQAVIEYLKTL